MYIRPSVTILVSALVAACSALRAADSRPNIIFLLTDDQTTGAVGCYGNKDIITPNIDKLASEGARFANHYNTTSICMASRANLVTGLYEYRHGCNFGHGNLERRFFANSYPVKLRQAGYFTGFAGKIGFVLDGEKLEVFEKEFDVWAGGAGTDELRNEEERRHREVCGSVSPLLAGLRSVGPGFYQVGQAERQAVLHEPQFQNAPLAADP
jgi:arylsulfatase A-like enzyme